MASPKVLIVEDNAIVREMIAEMVESLGYTAIMVPTGEAAQDRLAGGGVDILLSDVDLGKGLSGQDLVASRPTGMPQIIVLMSGDPQPDRLPLGTKYLSKPFTLTQLESALVHQ